MRIVAVVGVLALLACGPGDPSAEAADHPAQEAADRPTQEAAGHPAQEAAGARSGFVATPDGERIHYLEVGPGAGAPDAPDGPTGERPALLFIPGWTLSAEIWEPQLEHFGRTHRAVAMDPRAQGRSSKPREELHTATRAMDIRAVVDELGLEPVVLVGWSMGVTEVVAYVERFGTDGIAALALVDGLAGVDLNQEIALSYLAYLANWVHDRRGTTEQFVRGLFRTPRSEAYLEEVTEQALRTPTDAAMALVVGLARNDHRAALPQIDRPTLVAIAPGSPWDSAYEAMHAAIPGARLERFEGAGHALFVDQPERFNAALESLLEEVEGVAAMARFRSAHEPEFVEQKADHGQAGDDGRERVHLQEEQSH